MVRPLGIVCVCVLIAGTASGQDYYGDVGSQPYLGSGSVGSSEPLFQYDDQEQWKHGYLQVVPFYGGYHAGRPYNYHHVFSQTQTSVGWGLPHGMPYSQQWWHRFEAQADPGRVMTEPNGYYGYAPQQQQPNWQWAQTPAPAPVQYFHGPDLLPQGQFVSQHPIAPVQYIPAAPVAQPRGHVLPPQSIAAPGVDPHVAPHQSQQLRQYLAAPSAY